MRTDIIKASPTIPFPNMASNPRVNNDNHGKLAGKVAIVTGGASGFWRGNLRLFADQGARLVVIADIQNELGNKVAASIGIDRCTYVRCDVRDVDHVKYLVESTVNSYGRLDILFSNAGILSPFDQTVLDLDLSEMDRIFAVNVRRMAACVKHAARVMVEKRPRGSIVCTARFAGSSGSTSWTETDYGMSKHAVVGLMRAANGIRVNSVSPSGLVTPLTCNAPGISEERLRARCKKYARLEGVELTTKHVCDAVLFLASSDSEFITGHDLKIGGGFVG